MSFKDARLISIYKNAFLIYNPAAGKLSGNDGRLLDRVLRILGDKGHSVTAIATRGPRTATELARESIDAGADLILAAGGDGTINEVVNGMVHSEVPLGVLPAGTANVLAVELTLGTRILRTAGELSEFVPERISLGLWSKDAEARHFVLMAGAGFDALIVYHVNAGLKTALGKIAYWMGGFSALGRRLSEFDVTIEGKQIRCSFALASRVRNYGGDIAIARNASLFDDQFELVLFEGSQSFLYTKYLAGVLTNTLHNMSGVTIVRTREIGLGASVDPSVYVHVDGENVGKLPAQLTIVPRALTLLVPPKLRAKLHRAAKPVPAPVHG